MNRIFLAALLMLWAGLPVQPLASAEKWTPAQREIVKVLDQYAEAEKAGDLNRSVDLTLPSLTCWNFGEPSPMDRATWRKFMEGFFKGWKVLDCDLGPTAIHIDGEVAIAYGRIRETARSADGAVATSLANWSATLIRRDGRWLFLNWSWIEDRPTLDEAVIRQEVIRTMHDWMRCWERADLEAAMKVESDSPDFIYADVDGRQYDKAGLRKLCADLLATCVAEKVTTRKEVVHVLAPDSALYIWNGTVEIQQKDGSAQRIDPYSASFLLKRDGGNWKIHLQHESSLPPQTIKQAGAAPLLTQAPARSPEIQKLEALVGSWTTEGKADPSPLGLAGQWTGTLKGEWCSGGFAVIRNDTMTDTSGNRQRALLVNYYDIKSKSHHVLLVGSDGSGSTGKVSFGQDALTWVWDVPVGGKQYVVRGTLKPLSADVRDYEEAYSEDGKVWKVYFRSKDTRTK